MPSVTQRIKQVKQPYGGYLPVKNMQMISFDDGYTLLPIEEENIHAILVGLAVDYLFRYMSGETAEAAFSISLAGAEAIGERDMAQQLLKRVQGLDRESILAACKLSGFDVCVRAGVDRYVPVQQINPNEATVCNIRTMVCRCALFFNTNGPIVRTNVCFDGGYTATISAGDADYMTDNALWDLKVSRTGPTSKHTLQLLIYYIMGLHSIYPKWQGVQYIGILNPRIQKAYFYPTALLPENLISSIEEEIIGYGRSVCEYSEKPRIKHEVKNKKRKTQKRHGKRKRKMRIRTILFLLLIVYFIWNMR